MGSPSTNAGTDHAEGNTQKINMQDTQEVGADPTPGALPGALQKGTCQSSWQPKDYSPS